MKLRRLAPICVLLIASTAFADEPKTIATGLTNPDSPCLGPDGAVYVTEMGAFGEDGDGQVTVIRDGKAEPFVTGLDDPRGIALHANKTFYVSDNDRILKIDLNGNVTTFAAAERFPSTPKLLNDVVVEPEKGFLFVSDSGDLEGSGGAVFAIDLKSGKITTLINEDRLPGLHTPTGLAMDGASHLLLLDFGSGMLYRVKLADHSSEKVAEGFFGGQGLTWDKFGQLFISSWATGQIWGIPKPGQQPIVLTDDFQQPADLCVDSTGRNLLIADMTEGTLTSLPGSIPGWEVDITPLAFRTELAFPNLEWTGWTGESDSGLVVPLRPILLTHAGDGSNRNFVPQQEGIIHVFPNDDAATKTEIFLDISDRVRYADRQNEEGLLGLAFHPKFKTNGEFFVFYTDKNAKMANVVSRFRVSKSDPNRADPNSEEEILRIEKPYWNHDGGTILFGPDGYLYITHGDGGLGNDPHENGQNPDTLLGTVMRIDIDKKENGKNYAIPKDNPFVGGEDAAPEVWAYGIRNIWRMSFDRKTGQLWAGEVGQNLFEEINILKSGGNYGWNIRESYHPFGEKGVGVQAELIDPLWEYHHDIGKSITGGLVYRGKQFPELDGAFLYADYVSSRIWALWYDEATGRVIANREIQNHGLPIPSFGEDEAGEPYIMNHVANGRGIYRLVRAD